MGANQILPPVSGSWLDTSQSNLLSSKADAWREAFEKEQTAILQDAKSVRLGASPHSSDQRMSTRGAMPGSHRDQDAVPSTATPENPEQDQGTMSVAKGIGSSPVPASFIPVGSFLSTESFATLQIIQRPVLYASIALDSPSNHAIASSIALFESHYKQKWPLKNIHVIQSENGITLWIRDGALANDSAATERLVQRVLQAVKQDGQVLASLVINGKTIIG